ncbi:leucyl/phenylalanyl-tRNA--protein transferase [Sediminicurvatus halobius]|uniref:Leucyl/phenylalanyl-tRNA--protein transferase n=1 Tax=Sediminicurvatus halobius TaxID=2182432 RepID=A0A2U2N026_9GAMM|nr:leucyl/phenylalanyl-tRNA--protein transferase [Spiribacter halobius]PWG62407.1 leucyl/phenylalanyl-tRNA--protein transferase [Spiribacter halobius]UEX79507.1 leucyl/phenylalanyl-tRNA--protein transferase [Spiribacter halobius]
MSSDLTRIPWIAADDHDSPFPPADHALREPNGLLAIGGPLSRRRLEGAYRAGVFPWFAEDQPVLWWSPDPRAVLYPDELRVSRSLRKRLRRGDYRVTLDTAFETVIDACAAPRADASGTWITPGMRRAYVAMHDDGLAHSVEVWQDGALIGGLYGVALGSAFFGESMFSRAPDGSKIALAWLCAQLCAWGFTIIDCQLPTPHLERLGAVTVPRSRFLAELRSALACPTRRGIWSLSPGLVPPGVREQAAG